MTSAPMPTKSRRLRSPRRRRCSKPAQINLDYAYVKAPISGRISRAEITLGNLVGSPTTAPQLLASIVSDNGVYADFEVDEQTYLEAVRNYGQTQDEEQKIPVDVVVRGDDANVYQRSHRKLRQPHRYRFGHDPRPRPLRQ